jgi:hypothetical protein
MCQLLYVEQSVVGAYAFLVDETEIVMGTYKYGS